MDRLQKLLFPGFSIRAKKLGSVVDRGGEFDVATGTGVEPESRIGVATAGDDEHHRPVGSTEHTCKRFFVCPAREWAVAWMGMNPVSAKRFRSPTGIHLFVKEIGNGRVAKCDCHGSAILFHELDVFDQGQVIRRRQPKATDFGIAPITKEQQLAPSSWREPEAGSAVG